MSQKYDYARDIFENARIEIDNDNLTVTFTLRRVFSGFVRIKGLDKYIQDCLKIEYGVEYKIIINDSKEALVENQKLKECKKPHKQLQKALLYQHTKKKKKKIFKRK